MIIGLGTDIAELERIRAAHERFGHHFLQKILTPEELDDMPSYPTAWLAGRFAAKEAAVKALGTGFTRGISFTDIEIRRGAQGQPLLSLLGPAREHASYLGVQKNHISISHGRHSAVAVVILES